MMRVPPFGEISNTRTLPVPLVAVVYGKRASKVPQVPVTSIGWAAVCFL